MKYCQKSFASLPLIEQGGSLLPCSLEPTGGKAILEGRGTRFTVLSGPFDSFPGHEVGVSAEVPVAGQRLIDGPAQIELLNDAIGGQILPAADLGEDRFLRGVLRAEGLHMQGNRLRHADSIADLDFAPVRHAA